MHIEIQIEHDLCKTQHPQYTAKAPQLLTQF